MFESITQIDHTVHWSGNSFCSRNQTYAYQAKSIYKFHVVNTACHPIMKCTVKNTILILKITGIDSFQLDLARLQNDVVQSLITYGIYNLLKYTCTYSLKYHKQKGKGLEQ